MNIAVIGGGISGATVARFMADFGHNVDVFEKRDTIGGNCSDKLVDFTRVSDHGAHIFHTNDSEVWNWVNRFGEFHHYIHQVQAWCSDETHSPLPINMNTLMDYVDSIDEAKRFIENDRIPCENPTNLEEAALDKFGITLYYRYIKHYSEKQWGRPCTDIPPQIIDRIPLRYTFDNRYFTDKYQGIPTMGYTNLIESMLSHGNINVTLNKSIDYDELMLMKDVYDFVIYCGALDSLFNYKHGELEYRSLKFSHKKYTKDNVQGCSVVNLVSDDISATRSIEWKHFMDVKPKGCSIVTTETPQDYVKGQNEPYYPIGSEVNRKKYNKYVEELSNLSKNIIPLGRLAQYRYFDMDDAVMEALKVSSRLINLKK